MAASADLIVNIVTRVSGNGMAEAEKSTSRFKSGLASASKVAGVALVAVGAAALGAAKAAAEDAQGQALLANAMVNGAHATKGQIAQTEAFIDSLSRATGVADDELRPAMATLVRATGSVTKSQAALKTAMDISAATGKPLSSITDAMAKGFGGNTSALSRLVPGISQAALKSKNFARILKEVKDKTKGAANEAGQSAAGKLRRFQTSLGEVQEAAGAALLPILDKLAGVLVKLGNWAQDHGTLFTIIAGGVAAFAVAIIALNAALSVYNAITAVTAIVSASAWAATLGPILLVVAAVLLVVAAIVILWKKSKTFRTVVLAVWGAIKAGAKSVARFIVAVWNAVAAGARRMAAVIRGVWNGIRAAGHAVGTAVRVLWRLVFTAISLYVRAYLAVFKFVFGVIRSVVSTAVGWIRDRWHALWDGLHSAASSFADKMRGIWDGIRGGVSKLTAPFDTLRGAINQVISAVESLIGWLGKIHVPSIKLPHIPGVNSASVAGVAAPAVGGFSAPGVPAVRTGSSSAAGGLTIVVQGAVDPENTARQIGRILSGHQRRVGLRVS